MVEAWRGAVVPPNMGHGALPQRKTLNLVYFWVAYSAPPDLVAGFKGAYF